MLESSKTDWLSDNYSYLVTVNGRAGDVLKFSYEKWNDLLEEYYPKNDVDLKNGISILAELKNLTSVNFNECDYDLSITELNILKDTGKTVVLNEDKIYSDNEVNKIIKEKKFKKLSAQKDSLLAQIDRINTEINDLGI